MGEGNGELREEKGKNERRQSGKGTNETQRERCKAESKISEHIFLGKQMGKRLSGLFAALKGFHQGIEHQTDFAGGFFQSISVCWSNKTQISA